MRRSIVPKTSARSKELDDGIAEDVRKIKESMKETKPAVVTPTTTTKKPKTAALVAKQTPKPKQSRQRKERTKADSIKKNKEDPLKTSEASKSPEITEAVKKDENKPKSTNTCELKNELLADWLDEEDIKGEEIKSKDTQIAPVSVEQSAVKVPEKSATEMSRSIRNIPKKQRVSEMYIQPEKVELLNALKIEVSKSSAPTEVEIPPPVVETVGKRTQQKASKRKHTPSESLNEPEKKKLSEEVDDKILIATTELLNETEVPKLSNVQSPSTFHTNDIDKRYLPPKERNKRIFRAKNSPEIVSHTPIVTAVQKTSATDKPCDEKEKISTEYDLKFDDNKTDSAVGHTGATPVNNDDLQPPSIVNSTKSDRQELMLPHKKKQSSRLLTAEKPAVSDSPKTIVLEEVKNQVAITVATTVAPTLKVIKKSLKSSDAQNNVEKICVDHKTDSHLKDENARLAPAETSVKTLCTTVSTASAVTARGQKRQLSKDSHSDKNSNEFQPESKKVLKLETPKTVIACCSSETICITSRGTLAVARRDSIKTTIASSVVVTSQVIITEATKQPKASTQSFTSNNMISSSSSPKQQSISSAVTNPQQTLKNALKIPKENVEEMKKQGLVTIENNKTKLTPKGRQKFIEFQNEQNNLSPPLTITSATTSSTSILSSTTNSTSLAGEDSEELWQVERLDSTFNSQDDDDGVKEPTKCFEKVESEEAQKPNSVKNDESNEKDVEVKSIMEIDDDKMSSEESKPEQEIEISKKCETESVKVDNSKDETASFTSDAAPKETELEVTSESSEVVKEDTQEKPCNNNNVSSNDTESNNISSEDIVGSEDVTITASEKFGSSTSTKETEGDNMKATDSVETDDAKSKESENSIVENGNDGDVELDEISKDDEEKEGDLSQDSGNTGLIALQAETFGGPPNCFFLCRQMGDRYEPVDNQILVLNAQNALVPYESVIPDLGLEETVQDNLSAYSHLSPNSNIIINTPNGQKIELSQSTILALHDQADENGIASIELAGEPIELNINEILEAIAQQQAQETSEALIPGAVLLDSTDGPLIIESEMPLDIHHPSVATQVSETLSKPIMSTTVAPEITPTKPAITENATRTLNIEDSLATIGVTTQRDVPKSLELPITVTNPKIAGKWILCHFFISLIL